jgi:hypothetical protein
MGALHPLSFFISILQIRIAEASLQLAFDETLSLVVLIAVILVADTNLFAKIAQCAGIIIIINNHDDDLLSEL